MSGRPMLGNDKMVTVATRVEPDELQVLKNLATECGLSLCAYLREMIRQELNRAQRGTEDLCGIGGSTKSGPLVTAPEF